MRAPLFFIKNRTQVTRKEGIMITYFIFAFSLMASLFVGYSFGYWWASKNCREEYTKMGKLMIEPDGVAWMCVEDELNPKNLKDDQIIILQVKHTHK